MIFYFPEILLLIINSIPATAKGAITMSEPGFPEKPLKKIAPARADSRNRIPPASSHLHATTNISTIINDGMLCMKKQVNRSPIE